MAVIEFRIQKSDSNMFPFIEPRYFKKEPARFYTFYTNLFVMFEFLMNYIFYFTFYSNGVMNKGNVG